MAFVESKVEYSKGTSEYRDGTELCQHCKLYVTEQECGAPLKEVMDFAAITAALPCLLPRRHKKTLIQQLIDEEV